MSRAKGAGLDLSTEGAQDDFVEVPVIHRDYSHLASLHAYPLGDIHLGSPAHHADRWREWRTYLGRHKNTSMMGTGDFLNVAIIGEKSDVYAETSTVGKAKRLLRDQLKTLADQNRIDIMVPGNHEDRIRRKIGDCPIEDVAEQLQVPYSTAAVLLVYAVGDQQYKVYMRHGTGNGQALAALSRSAMVIDADVFCTGHTHAQAATSDEFFRLSADGQRAERHKRYYVSSGSFVGLEEYAAVRGYKPTRIGAPRIFLDGRKKDVHVSI